MLKPILLFSFLFLFMLRTFSQVSDSTFRMYQEKYPDERMYIQFDKTGSYLPGETIWFKSYLLSGMDLSEVSRNVYVDFYDENGKIISHIQEPVIQATAKGQFDIPPGYSGRKLFVKGYTRWMLNFDSSFLFQKAIPVYQVKYNNAQAPLKQTFTLRFFPEGGDLISGLANNLAFSCVNAAGEPVNVSGVLKEENASVATFSSVHDGMGKVEFLPAFAKHYTALWTDPAGVAHTTDLPAVKESGIALSVSNLSGSASFIVSRAGEAAELKRLYIVATIHQHLVFKARINLSTNTATSSVIPTKDLPAGILTVTVFDAAWKPVAERVLFVDNHDYSFEPRIRMVQRDLSRRGKNRITFTLPDSTSANMSVSVTDAMAGADANNNIISGLLLTSQVRGKIYHPAYYFSGDDSSSSYLDLVMLTHGWRRYNWDLVARNEVPPIKYPAEKSYLFFAGKVLGVQPAEIRQAQQINLILQGKDSSKHLLFPTLKTDGSFADSSLVFYDSIKVFYQFNKNRQLDRRAEVEFANGLFPSPHKWPVEPLGFLSDTAGNAFNKYRRQEQDRLNQLLKETTLEGVTVTAKTKSAIEKMDEKYTSGLFAGGDALQFDFMDDPIGQSASNAFQYLQGRVAGLQINAGANPPTLSWRGATPSLFVDEINADAQQLESIPSSDIAYIKVFRPPFVGAFGGGSGGAIAVYTKKGGDRPSTPGNGLMYKSISGYSPLKEFYSPDYSTMLPEHRATDLRSTIYWQPYILTNRKNNTATIEFYNNDVSRKLRLVLEGVDADGHLAAVEKILE